MSHAPDHPAPRRARPGETFLLVEWMAGAESRGGERPQVFVDGRPVGPVDVRIPIGPGEHLVSVHDAAAKEKSKATPVTIAPGQVAVLEYHSGQPDVMAHALLALLVVIIFALLTYARPDLFSSNSGKEWAMRGAALIAIGAMYAVRAMWRHASPQLVAAAQELHAAAMLGDDGPQLAVQRAYESTPAVRDPEHADEPVPGESRPAPAFHAGRLIVHLPCPYAHTISVDVDATSLGHVGEVLRVPAGRRQVQLRGWFESSRPFDAVVSPGALVELQAKPTAAGSLAMVVGALVAAAGIWAVVATEPDRLIASILAVLAAAGACFFIASRLAPTRELQHKKYRQEK